MDWSGKGVGHLNGRKANKDPGGKWFGWHGLSIFEWGSYGNKIIEFQNKET